MFPRVLRYYGSLRPCASHRYAGPWGSSLGCLSYIEATGSHVPHNGLGQSHAALCRMSSRRAADSPWTGPGKPFAPVSTSFLRFRHVRRGLTSVRLSVPQLTRSRRAVSLDAHHPGSLPEQLKVVWSLPCRPAPRGRPSSVVQQGCIEMAVCLHHGLLSAPSWRTVVGVANHHHVAGGRPDAAIAGPRGRTRSAGRRWRAAAKSRPERKR